MTRETATKIARNYHLFLHNREPQKMEYIGIMGGCYIFTMFGEEELNREIWVNMVTAQVTAKQVEAIYDGVDFEVDPTTISKLVPGQNFRLGNRCVTYTYHGAVQEDDRLVYLYGYKGLESSMSTSRDLTVFPRK